MTIPVELEEAARLDGCSPLGVFWHVILPLSKPALATLGIFTFMGTWNAFEGPLIFTDSLDMRTLPIGITIFQGHYIMEYGPLIGSRYLGGGAGADCVPTVPKTYHQRDFADRPCREVVGTATMNSRALMTIVLLAFLALLQFKSPGAMLTGDYFTHDPSRLVKCNGKYFVYFTGPDCPMRYSTDIIHWQTGPGVLSDIPAWARKAVPGNSGDWIWAPDVIYLNNQYYLFYAFSTFGRKVSVIGLATSPTLDPASPDYHWTDQGVVVSSNNSPATTPSILVRSWTTRATCGSHSDRGLARGSCW